MQHFGRVVLGERCPCSRHVCQIGAYALTSGCACAGLCCTVFVPETKRVDLDEAALHSKSMFGHFLDRCGVHQVNSDHQLELECTLKLRLHVHALSQAC